MNTRLQVEHPVTEMIHQVDLVAWQIAVAQGQPLPMTQAQIDARRRGASVECRVYAEDPLKFLPSPGTITTLRVPAGPYVRDDSGVTEGSQISVYYDPMVSKLVTWGDDRAQALARMRRALDEYRVGGIKTNLPFHRRLLRHPTFLAGEYDTGSHRARKGHPPRAVHAVTCGARRRHGRRRDPHGERDARETRRHQHDTRAFLERPERMATRVAMIQTRSGMNGGTCRVIPRHGRHRKAASCRRA